MDLEILMFNAGKPDLTTNLFSQTLQNLTFFCIFVQDEMKQRKCTFSSRKLVSCSSFIKHWALRMNRMYRFPSYTAREQTTWRIDCEPHCSKSTKTSLGDKLHVHDSLRFITISTVNKRTSVCVLGITFEPNMTEEASSGAQRIVVIAIDGSDNARYAFQCEYTSVYVAILVCLWQCMHDQSVFAQ